MFVSFWRFRKIKGVIPNVYNSYDSLNSNGQNTHYLSLTNYSEKYFFNDALDKRFEFGALLGTTITYKSNNKIIFSFNSRFYQSFTSLQKKVSINQEIQFNQTLFITVGCLVHLSN